MIVLRIRQIIEIVEAKSVEEVQQGRGRVVQACSNPFTMPLPSESLSGVSAFLVDVDSVGGVVSTTRASVATKAE
jgi:hypothetical protein